MYIIFSRNGYQTIQLLNESLALITVVFWRGFPTNFFHTQSEFINSFCIWFFIAQNANDKENQSMGKRKHRTSSAQEPSKLNSSLGDSSTAKLLRHLQGRVKQLRAENQSLKRTVTNDGTGSDGDSTLSSSTFEMVSNMLCFA